ncbi:MAG: hypothetical protein AAGA77_13630 [Bacteroidota bacterium]
MRLFALLILCILFSGCWDSLVDKPIDVVGMRPIYINLGDDLSIEARLLDNLTNIVTYQELILAMEDLVGIHIIDNSDPDNPQNQSFIPIFGINDLVVKDDVIIANAGTTFYSIDISDRTKAILKATSGIDANSPSQNLYPAGYFGLFECVDEERGIVINWELVEMEDSDCWR